MENLSLNDGEAGDGDIEAFCFRSAYERSYAQRAKTDFSYDTLKEVVDYGKRMKLKMCVSQRVAMWQMEFPESGIFFDKKFSDSIKLTTHIKGLNLASSSLYANASEQTLKN